MLRPWNVFNKHHLEPTPWDSFPSEKPKHMSTWRQFNPWLRIADFVLNQVTENEIDEILDLKSAGIPSADKADLFKRFFDDQDMNLKFIKKWRFIFTKVLWGKLVFFFFLYNNALDYFLESPLSVPQSMAVPFGEKLGSVLLDRENQIFLYCLLALWLTIGM
mmetsp:Transcript_893/g.1216  ORF Transcript_893/g.1216 Transcript_893/m.1216 type:complete len:162 (+) Transcript_893:1119-1604(+)